MSSDPLPSESGPQTMPATVHRRTVRRAVIFLCFLLVLLLVGVAGLTIQLKVSNERIMVLESQVDLEPRNAFSKEGNSSRSASSLNVSSNLFEPPVNLPALIEEVGRSVVDIYCGDGGGTGFAFDIDPKESDTQTVIVTNYHVIDDCWKEKSTVKVFYGESLSSKAVGKITGVDIENDLALIDISPKLPILKQSENFAEKGWWSMAIGNPWDPDFEISLNRYVTFGQIGYVLDNKWNYTSAVLNSGNSGGPLVNSRGELIGINTLGSSDLDIGVWYLAVDSDILCERLIICDD